MAGLTGLWFLIAVASAVGAWRLGARSGSHSLHRARVVGALGLGLLGVWVWLLRRPDILLSAAPAAWIGVLEGFAASSLLLLTLGVLWTRCRCQRQRVVVALGAVAGALYLLHGSVWMLQTTPQVGFAQTQRAAVQRQSQAYSCVPAACATALNRWGVETNEQEMALLTHTRPGTGATVVRAVAGLNQKLAGTGLTASVIWPNRQQMMNLPMPALTTVKAELANRHMVTILRVGERELLIADPIGGSTQLWGWEQYERKATGALIVFDQE